jgi:peptidyl-tRNA hydrolase, PTH1 family
MRDSARIPSIRRMTILIRLYAFLGNPGKEYSGNRHNVAWRLAESLSFFGELTWQGKFKGRYAARDFSGERIHFLLPETYMNNSGESAAAAAKFFKIAPEEILVCHDELEIPFGTVGFKLGGGLGGHNGLRSMKAYLGTPDFFRFRIGIGRPNHDDISAWVLSDLTEADEDCLTERILPQAARMLETCMAGGTEAVKDFFNKVKIE